MTSTAAEIEDRLKTEAAPRLFEPGDASHALRLAERFILSPFTLLDAKSGDWQDRKRMWLDKGLRSEAGRDARMLAKSVSNEEIVDPESGEVYLKGAQPGSVNAKILALSNGQSIFDPVLCEMAYLWFSPTDGTILDPFAGGSVRGLVAAYLGRRYVGVDLSERQISANNAQADEWVAAGYIDPDLRPVWICGDSVDLDAHLADVGEPGPFDLVWSCPPYFDLEVYSDNPADLSNMPWEKFLDGYGRIIEAAVDRLDEDRFAGFVVGEIREMPGPGYYRNFVGATIDAFERAGASYYNEAILVMPAGTLPLRTAKQFLVSRKLGRTHQTILWFVKGDPRKAATACLNRAAEEAAVRKLGRSLDEVLAAQDEAEDETTIGHG